MKNEKFLKTLFISTIFLSHLACGDDDIARLFLRFKSSARRYGGITHFDKITIRVSDTKKTYEERLGIPEKNEPLGQCWERMDGYQEVVVDKSHWEPASEFRREMILFHELAHCVLRRTDHTSGTIVRNGTRIPKSLMSVKAFPEELYLLNREYYLKELFQIDVK